MTEVRVTGSGKACRISQWWGHFRLLTANPKAEALYLMTETAKKKENTIQIDSPRVTCLVCEFISTPDTAFSTPGESSKRVIEILISLSKNLRVQKEGEIIFKFYDTSSFHCVLNHPWNNFRENKPNQTTHPNKQTIKHLSIIWLLCLWKQKLQAMQ